MSGADREPSPIWFNRPALTGLEPQYIAEALASGHLSGDGAFTVRCREALETLTGASRVLLTTSCTHALEMAVMLAGVGPGDEVICPAFTFVSSVNAFVLRGAVPRFVDIRPDTLNLDERLVEAAITPRTRAILLVHYAGVGCELDVLEAIARRHGLPLIEDNAHGLFGRYRGRAARQRRRHLDAELPRDQEPDLRRGRRPGDQRPGAHRSGRSAAREGHQPQPLLPRPGGQVHLGGHRLQLPAVGDPGRLSVGADPGPRRDPGAPARHLEPLRRRAGRLGRQRRRAPADRSGSLRAPRAHLLPADAVTGGARRVHRPPAGAADPGGVPLPAAAPVRAGPALRRRAADSIRSPRTSRIGWCGCRCTTT